MSEAPGAWGTVDATVGAVVKALMDRAGMDVTAQGSGKRTARSRAGRRSRPSGRAVPLMQRYEAWRRRWEGARGLHATVGRRRPILDVGCYEGTLAARLAEATGRPVVGVDLTDAGFARAFEQAHRLGVEDLVGCVRQDAHHLSVLGSGRFDVATFTYSLHCMADPERVVAEVVRVLAPGGLLLVVDWVVGPGEPRHGCYRLSAMEVEDMMRRTGLTVLNTVARSGVALVAAEKPLLDAVPRRAALGGQAAQGLPGLPGGVLEPAHVRARR